MRLWIAFVVAVAVTLAATSADAARLFMTTGPDATSGDIASNPVIDAMPNQEYTMHVWLQPDADQNYIGAAYNIAVDKPGVLTAVESIVDNPLNGALTRWANVNAGTLGGTLDPDGAAGPRLPENMLVSNARGAVIVVGTNPGIGSLAAHASDPGRDADTGAFHLGSLRVRAAADAAGSVGIYLRQGTALMNIRNGAGATITTNVDLFFGDDQTSPTKAGTAGRNIGDSIDATNTAADALLQFGGPPPVRPEIIQFTPDPNNNGPTCLFPAPSNTMPVNCDVIPDGPKVKIDAQGVQHDFFDVFFDVNTDDPDILTMVANQLTQEEGDEGLNFVRVLPNGSNPLLNGIDYDIQIQYSNTPGVNRFLDVDASVIPGAQILNVAIPEPSTWVLVACGLLGLAMARRRRAA